MGKLWSMRLSKCLPQTSINHHKPHSFISCTKSLPRPQSLSLLLAPEWAPVWRWPHLLRGDPLFLLSAPGSWLQFHRHTIWVICMVSHMHITWQQLTTCNPSKRIVANALVTRMMCNMHLCPTPVLRCCQAPEKFLLWAMQVVVWIASQVGCKAENRHHSETINMSLSPIFTDLVCLNTYHHPYIYHLISSCIHSYPWPVSTQPQSYSMPMHSPYISVTNLKSQRTACGAACASRTRWKLQMKSMNQRPKKHHKSQPAAFTMIDMVLIWQHCRPGECSAKAKETGQTSCIGGAQGATGATSMMEFISFGASNSVALVALIQHNLATSVCIYYPLPRHFWIWFSFSPGGICSSSSLQGIPYPKHQIRMSKPELLLPAPASHEVGTSGCQIIWKGSVKFHSAFFSSSKSLGCCICFGVSFSARWCNFMHFSSGDSSWLRFTPLLLHIL